MDRRFLNPRRGLSLEIIDTFLCFMDLRNTSQVAIKRQLSQPAITQQLKKFEEIFDPAPVFVQKGRNKQPTAFALELFDQLKNELEVLEGKLQDSFDLQVGKKLPRLRIGMRREIAQKVLCLIKYPGCLEVIEMSGASALESLAHRQVDLIVTRDKISGSKANYRTLPLFDDYPRIACAKKLISQEDRESWYLSAKFLETTPALFYKSPPPFFNRWCKLNGVRMQSIVPCLVSDDWNLISDYLHEGRGYSILPSSFWLDEAAISWMDLPKEHFPGSHFSAVVNPEFLKVPTFIDLWSQLKTIL